MTDPTDPARHAHVVDMHALHEATEAAKAAGVTDIQAVMPADPTVPTPGPRFVSRPQEVEAVQWTGTAASFDEAETSLPGKVRRRGLNDLSLLAGKDGSQEWVPVPVGHWLVHMPGDLSDVWPVDPDYFAGKYMPATVPVPGPDTPTWTVDDDGDPWWTDATGGVATVQVEAVEHHPAILDAYDALVADVRAARAHEHCGPATDTLRDQLAKSQARQEFYGKDAGHWKRKHDQATDTLRDLRESIAAEAELVGGDDHHYTGTAVAQILRALLVDGDGDG